ncbi:MAG: hypothetical protein ACLFVR_01170 [Thiohalospira sp.]
MKKILGLLSAVLFVILISAATINAQEPEKKEKKAKTEQCSEEKSKHCPSTCDKKVKAEKEKEKEKK